MFIYSYLMEKNQKVLTCCLRQPGSEDEQGEKGWEPVCDRPGKHRSRFHELLPLSISSVLCVRSVWKSKPTGHGWLLVYAWLMHVRGSPSAGKIKFTYQYEFDCIVLKAPSKQMGQKSEIQSLKNCACSASTAKSTEGELKTLVEPAVYLRPWEKYFLLETTGSWASLSQSSSWAQGK